MRRWGFILASLTVGCAGAKDEWKARDAGPAGLVATQATATAVHPKGIQTLVGPPPLPVGVTSFGAAALGEDVYVLGGYHGTPHQYDRTGQSGAFLRLSDGQWESLGEVEPLQSVALASAGGKVFRVGGMQIRNDPQTPADMHSISDVAAFDAASLTWRPIPDLPKPRSSHDVAVLDGKLFVVGGWELSGGQQTGRWHADGHSLDLSNPSQGWESFDVPFRRRALGVAASKGKLYAVGGIDNRGSVSSDVDILDLKTGKWSKGPSYPGNPFGVAVTAAAEAIMANGDDGVVYRLNAGDSSWDRVGTVAFPRFFHQVVVVDSDRLVVVGGIHGMTREARARQVERFSIDDDAVDAIVGAWQLESPSRAKNRMGGFLHGDSLYFFGGNRSVGQHDFEPDDFLDEGSRLHLPSLIWSSVAPYPARRQTMQTISIEGGGLAVGGFGHDGEAAKTHSQAFLYDFAKDTWTPHAASLPSALSQFGLALHDDRLWVFGGLNYDPSRKGEAAFDHRTDVLTTTVGANEPFKPVKAHMHSERRAFGGTVLGDRYYLVGGMQAGFQPVKTCESFDFEAGPRDEPWSEIPCPPIQLLSPQMVAIGDRLYLAGGSVMGEKGLSQNQEIWTYEPDAREWSKVVEQISLPGRHLQAFSYRGRLLLYSAHHEGVQQAQIALVRVVDRATTRQ